jgi:hypothetical protein
MNPSRKKKYRPFEYPSEFSEHQAIHVANDSRKREILDGLRFLQKYRYRDSHMSRVRL